MTNPIPVIDLFAGAGGLGEGFSSLTSPDGHPVFKTVMAVEKDKAAYQTLLFRTFLWKLYRANDSATYAKIAEGFKELRQSENACVDTLKNSFPSKWKEAEEEVILGELVQDDTSFIEEARKRLEAAGSGVGGDWVLIGGPPCQAYSGARRHTASRDREAFEQDPRQTLYKCYMNFVRELKPAMFVMENVVGLLSVKRSGDKLINAILKEMDGLGYEVRSVVKPDVETPRDYVVKAEQYGIPQRRHRVILLGVRKDLGLETGTLVKRATATVHDAIGDLDMSWQRVNGWYRRRLLKLFPDDPDIVFNHDKRGINVRDAERYRYFATFGAKHGFSPKIFDIPAELLPPHKNLKNLEEGKPVAFADRYRVQVWNKPSTTITAHIAKDGNGYIHPDAEQCRSLTVREAARLQTFPDDYVFLGGRTNAYKQVGNAVPPLLAYQIASLVADGFGREVKREF